MDDLLCLQKDYIARTGKKAEGVVGGSIAAARRAAGPDIGRV
jgi:hypothetical protein